MTLVQIRVQERQNFTVEWVRHREVSLAVSSFQQGIPCSKADSGAGEQDVVTEEDA